MKSKKVAAEMIEAMDDISSRLDAAGDIIKKGGDDAWYKTYLKTVEFVSAYLKQDVLKPIYDDHPDLKPDNFD